MMKQTALHEARDEQPWSGWAVSLAFWLCLLVAVVLYAAVAISPKLLGWFDVEARRRENQIRLVMLERQVVYLERVVRALEHEPQFANELARVDFDAARPGEERIAVDPAHALDAEIDAIGETAAAPRSQRRRRFVVALAADSSTRVALLTAAAVLTVFAFTILQESQADQFGRAAGSLRARVRELSDRYRDRE